MKDKLSVIIPVYGEKELVKILYDRLIFVLRQMPIDYNIIYVNDADPHGCKEELEKIAFIDEKVILINFDKNYGEEFAVKAGIDYCDSDYAIVMDCDLQDRPEDIPLLYQKIKDGYEVVWGERIFRDDSVIKKLFSSTFYFVYNLFSDVKINKRIGSFSVISKKIINILKSNNSYGFNYIQAVKNLKFKEAFVSIKKDKRPVGKSSYNFIKGLKLALKILFFCRKKQTTQSCPQYKIKNIIKNKIESKSI